MHDQHNFERTGKLRTVSRQCLAKKYLLIVNKFSDISAVILNREDSKSLKYLEKFLELYFCNKC